MTGAGGDLLDPLERDALMLLDRKRVVGRLQNDSGPQIAGSNKYVTPDVVGFRVTVYPIA